MPNVVGSYVAYAKPTPPCLTPWGSGAPGLNRLEPSL